MVHILINFILLSIIKLLTCNYQTCNYFLVNDKNILKSIVVFLSKVIGFKSPCKVELGLFVRIMLSLIALLNNYKRNI